MPPPRHVCQLEGLSGLGWSRLFADPVAVLTSTAGVGSLRLESGGSEPAIGEPFRLAQQALARWPAHVAAGYWGYELRHWVERLPPSRSDDLGLPDCWIGIYPDRLHERPAVEPMGTAGPVECSVSRGAYEAAVRRILDYIAAGDCYQVNLSRRFSGPYAGSAWGLYQRLRQVSPAPYSAFLDCGDHQVVSSSPELFLRIRGTEVETRPIKGTRPRGRNPEEDAAAAAELLSSPKDRAELVMIVDLERNDLGRVCRFGSVTVPELYRLESFANVHHLVATVKGELRPGVTPLECLRAAFPGGSITGAPKIRAMQIIEELEPVRRGVYTGAIGWVDGRGNAEWSIAIRTMTVKDGRVTFHTGGGVVADSDPAAEYEETQAKARGMLAALGIANGDGP